MNSQLDLGRGKDQEQEDVGGPQYSTSLLAMEVLLLNLSVYPIIVINKYFSHE